MSDEGFARIEAELKKDPARTDMFVARTAGMSKASVYRTRYRMELEKIIPVIPVAERVRENGHKVGHGKRGNDLSGPRIKVPDGVTLVEHIKSGIRLEDSGKNADDAAYLIGVGASSYREARAIVRLSENDDLTKEEKELAAKALKIMSEELRTRRAYELVRKLADRVWGKGKHKKNEKTAKRIVEEFINAVSVITIACDRGSQLTVPQLSTNDAASIILQLKEAVQAIKELRSKLTRRIQ